jgi:hypothetical protein
LTPQPGIIRWPYGGIDAKDETMAIPVLLVVDDNPDSLKALDGVLRHRYGRDYLIISEASPGTALGRLRELRAAGRPVAVVMAAGAMTAAPGAEFLAQARGIQPGAKRVLVVPRGGPAAPSLRVPVPLVQDRQAAAGQAPGSVASGVLLTMAGWGSTLARWMSLWWWWGRGRPGWRRRGRSAGRVLIRWWWRGPMRWPRRGGNATIISG